MSDTVRPTVEIPSAGRYRLVPARSTIPFRTRHMFGLAPVRGTFDLGSGEVTVADPVEDSAVRATIPAASFATGTAARDDTVRSARYLDADNHPDITFVSTGLDQRDGGWTLCGTLTVCGTTGRVEMRVTELRVSDTGLRLRGECLVDRYAFGVTAMKGMTGRWLTLHPDVAADRV